MLSLSSGPAVVFVLYWSRLEGGGFKCPPVVEGVMGKRPPHCSTPLQSSPLLVRAPSQSRCPMEIAAGLRCVPDGRADEPPASKRLAATLTRLA